MVVEVSLTVDWLVVEPVLKIRYGAVATPLEPNSILPATWRSEAGEAVPMPTLPVLVTLKVAISFTDTESNLYVMAPACSKLIEDSVPFVKCINSYCAQESEMETPWLVFPKSTYTPPVPLTLFA